MEHWIQMRHLKMRQRSLLPGKMKGSWGAGEAKGLGKVKDVG